MDYNFVKTDWKSENLKLYSDLLSKVFTDTKKYTSEFLDWQYSKNPNGKVVGFDAFYGSELAAHYVTIPVQYNFNDEIVKGLLSLNTVTHPQHQGKGLFTKLAERTYDYGAEQEYKFVIGVANQNSTHGFLKKLGFNLISPLDVQIFTGKPKAGKINSDLIKSEWSSESAAWRLTNPSANYLNNNSCVSSKTHLKLIHAILSKRTEFKTEKLISKSSSLKMTIGLNIKNKLKVNLPASLKPSPLNLIFKPLGDFKKQVNKTNIYFELIDFDAY